MVASPVATEGVGKIGLPTVGHIRIPIDQSRKEVVRHLRQRKEELQQEINEIDRAIAVIHRKLKMRMFFKNMVGELPRCARTVKAITVTGVSVKRETRTKFSTSDQLKLSKSA